MAQLKNCYPVRVAACISEAVNCIVLLGDHNQTISGRAYCNRHSTGWGRAYRIINALFFFQEDHCRTSHLQTVKWARRFMNKVEDMDETPRS